MSKTISVNFHCHSVFSDGDQTPEALAASLASAGVRFAALTDHDSVEGLFRFQEVLKKRGVASVSGVELTTSYKGREVHILGYGFDPFHPDLSATLQSLRQVRELEVQSIAGSLRKMGSNHQVRYHPAATINSAPNGRLDTFEAISLLHRAGGKAFLAHPLIYESDPDQFEDFINALQGGGLDGLEALYAPYSEAQRNRLRVLAHKYSLLMCAGTDFHTTSGNASDPYAIEIAREDWNKFRDALFTSSVFAAKDRAGDDRLNPDNALSGNPIRKPHHFRRRSYVLRIFLPTIIAILLFLAVIWNVILPSFEQSLLDRKRELIRELTNSAWSILVSYQQDEQKGVLSREEAQSLAIERIAALRYGPEGKDYFWVQDFEPKMIMHPYRPDLNGQDLSSFTDPRGVKIFVEFANLVRQEGEGYIDYVFQWKDDPQRLVAKESYIKGFEPWGWVIGTGIYTDDVRQEIALLEKKLISTSLAVSGVIVLLLLFVLQQSLRIEHERQEVVNTLHESTERYHTLIESTTEGTLLILDDHCRYANPTFLNMTGYSAAQLEFLELADLLPQEPENQTAWDILKNPLGEISADIVGFEGILRHSDGHLLECILSMNLITVAGQKGIILLARDIANQSALLGDEEISRSAKTVPVGIFRARANRRAIFIETNPAARAYLAHIADPQPALADLFPEPAEFDAFFHLLQDQGEVRSQIVNFGTSDASTRTLSISARMVHDEQEHSAYIDGTLQDVTEIRKKEIARDALIERLQASLLFLHQPITNLGRTVVVADMDTSIEVLARRMTERNVTAALVSRENANMVGIITDHDLRDRVLAGKLPLTTPIYTIMSSPVTKISEDALIYEALMKMEEKGVRHLAVEDSSGQIVGLIDSKSLIQFQRYGPIVLTREISRAASADEIAQQSERTPLLVKTLLNSSARPRHVTEMLSSVCDTATERLLQLAIDELGQPPVAFAFIGMGSQGRQEQTLLTDQDNGIIFAPVPESDLSTVTAYFLQLGERVCQGLNRAHYHYCPGKVMANNPRWCRSLPEWIAGFNEWVFRSEAQEIIDLSIFFDFRTVYGDSELTQELRRAIYKILADQPAFFPHFARNAQLFKPPVRLLGNIYIGGGSTEHGGEINLKDAMMPMVAFARLYALRHQVNATHTLERIETLSAMNVILPSSRDEIITAYDFLMQLRLQHQVASIENGHPPQNTIQPGKLGTIQQELLKQAFAQISAIQKKVSYDFLGGGE